MTPKQFRNAILVVIFATMIVLVISAVTHKWVLGFVNISYWQYTTVLWLLIVGIYTCGKSINMIGRTMGERPTPRLETLSQRNVSVGKFFNDAVANALGREVPPRPETLPIADEIIITCGPYTFSESEIKKIVIRGWQRQTTGRHPLSRRYWLSREPFYGDRQKYDAFTNAIEASGHLVGRRDGASGKLVKPPHLIMSDLKHLPYQ